MKFKKFGALLLSAVLCIGMAVPAFAYESDTAPVEEPVLPEVVKEEDAVTITDEETGALTPEGNLSLVDDYHTSYSDGSGQQFITLVSKSGNTFYLVIDRNAKGQQTVHFMNLVDEADLLALMEEEDADAYTAEKEAAAQAEQERKQAEEDAKKAAEEGEESGTLFITECQTGGRGRRGRNWVSPPGSGIWMTLLLRPQINPANASMLTIVAAMAVTMAIRRAVAETGADVECHIKWPNDVVINKKKVCGILTEMSAELDCIHYVVIGIGINVNTTEFADEIKETASSLFVETGKNIKRSRIVALFAEEFTKYYQKFLNTGDLSGLVQDYNEMLINAGRQVRICDAKEEFNGVAAGIDSHGKLLVTKEDGTQAVISAGEVSVRGLYGYV